MGIISVPILVGFFGRLQCLDQSLAHGECLMNVDYDYLRMTQLWNLLYVKWGGSAIIPVLPCGGWGIKEEQIRVPEKLRFWTFMLCLAQWAKGTGRPTRLMPQVLLLQSSSEGVGSPPWVDRDAHEGGNMLPTGGFRCRDCPHPQRSPKPVTFPKQAGHGSIF